MVTLNRKESKRFLKEVDKVNRGILSKAQKRTANRIKRNAKAYAKAIPKDFGMKNGNMAERICTVLEPRIIQLCKKFRTGNYNAATMPAFWMGAEADVKDVLRK